MKRAIATIAITLALMLTACSDNRAKIRDLDAQTKLDTIIEFRDLNDAAHNTNVKGAELILGSSAAFTLMQCYQDGYDSVQNDDHSFRNNSSLGPKYIEKCDRIAKRVQKSFDDSKKQHDKKISH